MSAHNNLNWSDFLLCIGMELAFHKNRERPEQEQMIAEKMIEMGTISKEDLNLFVIHDDTDESFDYLINNMQV